MKLYLDDERETPAGWERVYNAKDCIEKLATRTVEIVSLDHDLGQGCLTGYDVMLWIEKEVFTDPTYTPPRVYLHTANPSGKEKMWQCLEAISKELRRRERQLMISRPETPPEQAWDDTVCAHCGDRLPTEYKLDTPVEQGYCDVECQSQRTPIIRGVADLANYVGANPNDLSDIERRICKDQSAGAGLSVKVTLDDVSVAPYCEGVDYVVPSRYMRFPFKKRALDDALAYCESESEVMWNNTHGCEACYPDEYPNGGGPIRKDCPVCGISSLP